MTTSMGTTETTLTTPESELADKISTFHAVAKAAFKDAADIAQTGQATNESKEAADVRRTKAKSQMSTALDQMAHAEAMFSDQRGRVGYDAVVTLMEGTRDAAGAVYTKLIELVNANTVTSDADQLIRERQIGVLGELLVKLSHISPIAVWQNYPPTTAK